MCTVAQDELVVLLEVFPDEECLPIDLFQHFQSVYEQAAKGTCDIVVGNTYGVCNETIDTYTCILCMICTVGNL